MRLKNLMKLVSPASLMILTACATTIPEPLPCPAYPELIALDPEIAAEVPARVKAVVTQNYILLDEYAQRLEVRAGCE